MALTIDVDLHKNIVELSDKNGLLISKIFAELLIEHLQNYVSENTNEQIDEKNRQRLDQIDAEIEQMLKNKAKGIKPPCIIYLAKDMPRNIVKIGCTASLASRINQLKTSNGGVELLSQFSGNRDDEKNLHKTFTCMGKRVSGEWFSLGSADIDYIESYFDQKNQSK